MAGLVELEVLAVGGDVSSMLALILLVLFAGHHVAISVQLRVVIRVELVLAGLVTLPLRVQLLVEKDALSEVPEV